MSTAALRQAATGQQPGKALSPLATVQHYFEAHKQQIANALPKHMSPDRMVRLATTALSQNRQLQECDAKSIFGAVVTASQLGLEPGVLGQCYLIPYGKQCTFVPGWRGLADLVARGGRASVWTGAVFEGDEFDYALGDSPYVTHKPCGENDPDLMLYVYAVGRIKGAQWPIIEVWPAKRVWTHRDRYNKVGRKHYSFEHPEMYARKVVLLQVLKYLPMSIELTAAVELSERQESGAVAASIDGDFVVMDSHEAEGDAGPRPEPEHEDGGREAGKQPALLPDFLNRISKWDPQTGDPGVLDAIRQEAEEQLTGSAKKAALDAIHNKFKAQDVE